MNKNTKQKIKNKKQEIKIGQEVFIIERDLTISKQKIVAIVTEEKEKKYKLEINSCGGITENDFCLTKPKAEVKKKNFLDDLKFKVGDLVVFEYRDYSAIKKALGLITKIEYSGKPYEIRGAYEEYDSISDEDILLKVKNEFIENYGNLQELYKQFKEKEKEIQKIISLIRDKHDELEKELEHSIIKQYGIFNWNKSKPKFKDRFNYKRDYYD